MLRRKTLRRSEWGILSDWETWLPAVFEFFHSPAPEEERWRLLGSQQLTIIIIIINNYNNDNNNSHKRVPFGHTGEFKADSAGISAENAFNIYKYPPPNGSMYLSHDIHRGRSNWAGPYMGCTSINERLLFWLSACLFLSIRNLTRIEVFIRMGHSRSRLAYVAAFNFWSETDLCHPLQCNVQWLKCVWSV